MIELPNKRDQDFVLEAIGDWEGSHLFPTPVLTIGGEDYSDRIPEGDYSQDSVPLTLETTFIPHLPLELYGESLSLSVSIGGRLVPCMQGAVSLPEDSDDMVSTKLLAASVGSMASEDFPLNEQVSFSDARPDYVAHNALRRLPYLPGSIRVEPVDKPLLTFARGHEEGPFEADQNVGDIFSKLEEKALYIFRDTAWGGCKAHVSTGLSKIPEIPDYMRYNSEKVYPPWKSPALAIERYAYVVVFKDNPDGSKAFEDAWAKVPYRGHDRSPHFGRVKRIAFTGTDAQEAQQLAYRKALEYGRGAYKSEPILPFNPLLELTDVFTVLEVKKEDKGTYERDWLHYVDAFEQSWSFDGGDGGFQTKPTCSVTLLSEQLVKAPSLILGLISGGILKTPPRLLYFVANSSGFYFDADLTGAYVSHDSTGMYVDPALSEGRVAHNSDGFYFEI